jgi:hypothetical protein
MESPSEERRGKSWIKPVLAFALHQFVATLGVLVAAPWLVVLGCDLLRMFGRTIYMRDVSWLLTETPYYPVQVVVALFLGRFLGFYLRHRSMVWVWVLPFLILSGLFIANARVFPLDPGSLSVLAPSSRLSHFFGWGCLVQERSFDQLLVTMPFYAAVAYSLGALSALKSDRVPDYIEFMNTIDEWRAILFVGVPCFCLMLALNWQLNWQGFLTNRFLRTGFGFLGSLVAVLVESTILTFLCLVVIGLIGRGSFLRRKSPNASR